jgi:hypothetical protein
MGLSHSPSLILDGLIVAIDAGNTRSYSGSGNTWFDLSGNGNHFILDSGVVFDSTNRGSIYFDGTKKASCNMSWPSNFTFQIVIRPLSYSASYNYGRIIGTGPSWNFEFAYGGVDQRIRYWQSWTNTNSYASLGNIEIYTFVKESNNVTMYKNGSNVYQGTVTATSGSTIYLATDYTLGAYVKINIFSFHIYNRALSAAEIKQNYNATKKRYGL